MKKLCLLLLTYLSVLSVWAAAPFREHRFDSFKVLAPAEGSILFLGNSITDMHCWPEVFKTSNGDYLPIVNRGVSGTYSTEQSDNLESYLLNKPKKVFMMIGTNDLASTGGLNYTGEQILTYVKSIVGRVHMRYPGTKIYLYSILNNDTYNREQARWLHANELFKAYADATENVTYIDLYDKLKDVNKIGVYSYDKLHLTAAAYQVWSETICDYLAEGESYKVISQYPTNAATAQKDGGLATYNGMRATYFSLLPITSDDVLVFGDELVKNGEWQELLGNYNVKNRGTEWGYGGSIETTSKLVDATFAQTGVKKENPKAIFVYTGTADANNTSTNITTVQNSYKALVEKIAAYSPNSRIYLMGLAPTKNASNTTNRIAVLNNYLKSIAVGNIEYVDTYSPVLSGSVADSKYIDNENYLLALGYVKFAQKMKEALADDFPNDKYMVLSDEEAQVRYNQATLRNRVSQAIGACMRVEAGESVGQISAAAMLSLNAELTKANALLSGGNISDAQAEEQAAALTTLLNSSINYPKASTATEQYWYQITSLRASNRYITATGAANGVVGSLDDSKFATSMWKFVDRGNGSYDIVNREYGSYLNPVADYNTQIKTVATKPASGWTIGNSNTTGYFIISSGEVQLNQTGEAQSYKLYNWSNSANKGNDKSDDGCQLMISVAQEPEELPELPDFLTFTVDKTNGDLYHKDGGKNQSWNCSWKSKDTPQLQFGCGTINNMTWNGNNVVLMTGTANSSNYSITAPAGYVIEEYSFDFTNNNGHNVALNLTMDDGTAYSTTAAKQTASGSNLSVSSVSFTLVGNNGNGVLLTNFTVKVKVDAVELPQFSTANDVHWYYITSASTKSYCAGKVMYYDEEAGLVRFGDKAFSADRIWSFWESNGKLAIKNYNGDYFATPGAGTGDKTKFGVQETPNYIYNIEEKYGFYIINDGGVELHAQDDNKVIVRWAAEAAGASLWKFDKVDISNSKAAYAGSVVAQGKVTTGIGNKNQPIIRSTIRIAGLEGSCNFQGVKGTFVGDNAADITNVKAYFATNARELFVDAEKKMDWRDENGQLFGQPVTLSPDGTFVISGTKALSPGNNYLWITYDIADSAVEGHTVDATISSYTIDGKEIAEKNGNPANAVTIFLSEGAVLMPMDNGSLYYRIPAITVTRDGKRLVTLTDDRKGHNGDLPSHCYLVAQYSEDNGRTWSEPVTVAGTEETGGNYGHGDASIVTNRDNGDIVGIMTSAGTYGHGFWASTAAQPQRWKTIVSHDGGLSWEAPVDHTDALYGANCSNTKTKTWQGGFSGSGAALQKRDGTLVSSFVNREADGSKNFYFFMSDDGGKNWYVSGNSGTKDADEPKTLERNNGDLAISVRSSGYNYYNYTSDNGNTWHKNSQTRFTSGISGNACDGEYMVWCSTLEGNPWNIAFQTLPNNSSRQNVSIALSTDEGASFLAPKTICPVGSAYSAAVVLPDGSLGVYYEENGVFGGFTMRFVRFSLNWASDGKYKFTKDAPFYPIKSTNTTSVEEVEILLDDEAVYNMMGQKVDNPTLPGIYIKGGKKFLIK